jgi:hypothetical protein
MTWFGGPGYLVLLAAVVVIRLAVDWWLLHTGRIVHYKLVSHRKLRASRCARTASVDLFDVEAGPRPVLIRPDAGTQLRTAAPAVRIGGAAVRTPGELPHPVPGLPNTLPPGAGPQTPAIVSRPWRSGQRGESQTPREGDGSGCGSPTVGRDSAGTPCEAADETTNGGPKTSGRVHPSAGGPQQPVTVGTTPDPAVTGPQPHPRDEEVADAVRPRLAASATQLPNLVHVVDHWEFPLDAGAVAQTAPVRSPA